MGHGEKGDTALLLGELALLLNDGFAIAFRRVDSMTIGARAVRRGVVVESTAPTIQGVIQGLHGKISEGVAEGKEERE